ncbi:DUF2807 domain-containing protein [uncultured Polaribacter sp.]|uniref:GIN domain-containing protein n=1 Tax=uncultured Polaribacter sp. TaxID=174711 RepID=UPI002625955E|nr:DUF2807 domain-containing protein [uncultured Polaribacter sp.]
MKIKIILLLLLFSFINTTNSQEKIKGNKNVTRVKTDLNLFRKIVINNDFKIKLIKSENSFVEIETDENIHEVIDIDVVDATLTISTELNIKAKRLNITIYYKESLQEIILNDDAELESLAPITTASLLLQINDYSIAELIIKADEFNLINNNKSRFQLKSKSDLQVTSKKANLLLNESSNTKLDINVDSLSTKMMKNAILDIKGTAASLKAFTAESANLKGEALKVDNCFTSSRDSAVFIIQASSEIVIDASEKSRTEIYGDPKIIIDKLTGTSRLFKKEL